MAKKATLTVTRPDGEIAPRTTARTYPHVVVYRHDLGAARAAIESDPMECAGNNFRYVRRVLAAGVGGSLQGHCYPVDQHQFDKASEELAGAETAEQYIAAARQRHLDRFDAKHGDALVSNWVVDGWAGRLDLAQKGASKAASCIRHVIDVQIIPVNGAL